MGALPVFGEQIQRDACFFSAICGSLRSVNLLPETGYVVRNDSPGHQLGNLQDMAPYAAVAAAGWLRPAQ